MADRGLPLHDEADAVGRVRDFLRLDLDPLVDAVVARGVLVLIQPNYWVAAEAQRDFSDVDVVDAVL